MYSKNRYVYSSDFEIKEKDKPENSEHLELDGGGGGRWKGQGGGIQNECPQKEGNGGASHFSVLFSYLFNQEIGYLSES